MHQTQMERLLQHAAFRLRLATLALRFHHLFLILAGVYALLLLASRLLALAPNWFAPLTVIVPPLLALIVALLATRAPDRRHVARVIDTRTDGKDLFLTAATLDESIGDFRQVVLERAEARAGKLRAGRIAPFAWKRRAARLALVPVLLLAGVFFLPQLDPFGKEQQRRAAAERRRRLEVSREETKKRIEAIKQENPEAERSPEVQQRLADLRQTFAGMRKSDKLGNLKRLGDEKQKLTDLWQKSREEKLRDALARTPADQRFGGAMDAKKREQWRREMDAGKTDAMQKEIAEIKDLAQRAAAAKDAAEREKLQRELQQRLGDMADFMAGELGSRKVSAAMQRAMEQLAMSAGKGLEREAMQALQESLNLSNMEIQQLAQNMRDMQSLEQAMKALQMAAAANKASDGVDGKPLEGMAAMAEYEAFFRNMLVGAQPGEGGGMVGPGIGQGGKAPEDDSLATKFKSEKSQSALQAGKILLSWKTQGMSEAGAVNEDYRKELRAVRQGVSEAILSEEVPPGYHDAIRKYFDSLEKDVEPKKDK